VSRVILERVAKRFGDVTAVAGVSLEVEEGELLTLLGPSGCGKTTLLRLVAGFTQPTSGRILIDGEDVTRVPPQRRTIGMVFQDYALFPHLTIEENVAFGLRERGVRAGQIRVRVRELLELIRLPGVEHRYPAELSGGQQQRVALARAVAWTPRVLLMDEPLGALDLKLREVMQVEVRRIQRELKITTVYVTHDQTEAMNLSDHIAVMKRGEIVQVGNPEEIYRHPQNRFVADFVGRINFLPGRVVNRGAGPALEVTGRVVAPPPAPPLPSPGARLTLGIRPERLRILTPGQSPEALNVFDGTVTGRSFVGNLVHVLVQVPPDLSLLVEQRPDDHGVVTGQRVQVAWAPGDASLLEAQNADDDVAPV
jgi:spermidine/putrescine ABC transporter ATP-binding subunit